MVLQYDDDGATLATVRELIDEELDDVPEFFKFVNANGVKVSNKQELKKQARDYMPLVTIVKTDK